MTSKILIVGLGNPGPKYQNSRHNLGFMVLDKLARRLLPLEKTKWKMDKRANALVLKVNPQLILAKPQTFVNASGYAVAQLTRRYTLDANQLWIVHDDVDLPLGKLKIRFGGASAGHHGVESIIQELGTDKFWRVRTGIGKPLGRQKTDTRKRISVEEYVLEEFRGQELGELKIMIKRAVKAIEIALKDGPEKAMSRFN